jgi:hypothetical protein
MQSVAPFAVDVVVPNGHAFALRGLHAPVLHAWSTQLKPGQQSLASLQGEPALGQQ